MGVGDLVCRLVIGPLITIWKLDVTKLYAFSQLACAISIASFPMVMNGVQMIIQGFLFSVTFGCQCLLLGNLSTNPLMITVGLPTGLNLMAFYFVHSARTPCSLWKWTFESNFRFHHVFWRNWNSYWSTYCKIKDRISKSLLFKNFFQFFSYRQDLLLISRQVALIGWPLFSLLLWNSCRRSPQSADSCSLNENEVFQNNDCRFFKLVRCFFIWLLWHSQHVLDNTNFLKNRYTI